MQQLNNLLEAWENLGERERKILCTFAMRLWAGQRRYGQLTVGKKDWTYEAIEEALDASVYLACLLNDKTDKAFNAMVADAEKEVTERAAEVPKAEVVGYLNKPSIHVQDGYNGFLRAREDGTFDYFSNGTVQNITRPTAEAMGIAVPGPDPF